MLNILIEAFVVGLATIFFGFISSFIIEYFSKVFDLNTRNNLNTVMALALFLTGVLAHLTFEFLGLNKWYCKYGVACK